MPLPGLDPESLTVWLFGPGYGELVIVRAPPGNWLVVDGCSSDGARYAQRALDNYGAKPSLLLLSHPHEDHAQGLREVIERATKGDKATWPLLGMVPAPDTLGAGDLWDAVAALDGGVAEQVVATILERWRQHAACKWDLEAGSSKALGEAQVRVLSPSVGERDAAVAAWRARKKQHNYNRAATALLVTWRGRRLLLGSDLVEEEGHGWTAATGHDANLHHHDVYKVAHHGSTNAIGPQTASPNPAGLRTWIATPFSKRGLPRSHDGDGLHRLLPLAEPIELTGLPRGHDEQSSQAEERSRAQLRDNPTEAFPSTTTGYPDCWVCVRIREHGAPEVQRGPGSVRVRA